MTLERVSEDREGERSGVEPQKNRKRMRPKRRRVRERERARKTRKRGAKGEVTKAVHTQDPHPTATSPEDSGDIKAIQYVIGTEAAKNL